MIIYEIKLPNSNVILHKPIPAEVSIKYVPQCQHLLFLKITQDHTVHLWPDVTQNG